MAELRLVRLRSQFYRLLLAQLTELLNKGLVQPVGLIPFGLHSHCSFLIPMRKLRWTRGW